MGQMATLISVGGGILAIATFFIGRVTNANKGGREMGELLATVKIIDERSKNLEKQFSEEMRELRQELKDERTERVRSARELHEKINEHIANHHH
jgi:signal transduction histidine kinase